MKKRIGIIALLLLSASLGLQAKILRVNNSPNIEAGYNSLSNALLDAAIGDSIYLEPSSQAYGERDAYGFNDMKINKQVTILGPGYYLAENKITDYAAGEAFIGGTVHLQADNINISGVIMSNVRIEANNVSIQRCQILNGSSTAVKINTDVNGSVVEQSFIVGDIVGQNYPHNVMVSNCIICGNVTGFERSRFEHNTFGKYNRFGTIKDVKFCTVIENIMENQSQSKNNTTAFVNNFVGDYSQYMEKADYTLDANYRIKLGSPISTKASDGGPLGAFGGELPYVISGLPDVPVISNVTGPTSVNSFQGLPITVTYKIDK